MTPGIEQMTTQGNKVSACPWVGGGGPVPGGPLSLKPSMWFMFPRRPFRLTWISLFIQRASRRREATPEEVLKVLVSRKPKRSPPGGPAPQGNTLDTQQLSPPRLSPAEADWLIDGNYYATTPLSFFHPSSPPPPLFGYLNIKMQLGIIQLVLNSHEDNL